MNSLRYALRTFSGLWNPQGRKTFQGITREIHKFLLKMNTSESFSVSNKFMWDGSFSAALILISDDRSLAPCRWVLLPHNGGMASGVIGNGFARQTLQRSAAATALGKCSSKLLRTITSGGTMLRHMQESRGPLGLKYPKSHKKKGLPNPKCQKNPQNC